MKETTGDLFKCVNADAICITTNDVIKGDGTAVMGAGCAGQAKKRWPGIECSVAYVLERYGNVPTILTEDNGEEGPCLLTRRPSRGVERYRLPYHVVTFPTKRDWRRDSIPDLIRQSAVILRGYADARNWERVVIPRPGCGNRTGGLRWKDVKPLLVDYLDDRFEIITFK